MIGAMVTLFVCTFRQFDFSCFPALRSLHMIGRKISIYIDADDDDDRLEIVFKN